MKNNNKIEIVDQKFQRKYLNHNLNIKEKAAFKMLQQQKIRKILEKDIH